MALNKEQMREYMRKRRTEKREKNLPASVLAEPIVAIKSLPLKLELDGISSSVNGEARESTRTQVCNPDSATSCRGLSDSRGGQSFSYDRKKYPNRGAWEIAVEKVERAVRYAQMFPNLTGSDDLKFQTLDWQYQNEGIKASCK